MVEQVIVLYLAIPILNEALCNGTLQLPQDSFFIGDDAFPLRTTLVKPYIGSLTNKQRIFNYRSSRARRVVENAFGILRFRVFHGTIHLKEETVDLVIKASCALHNWLRTTSSKNYLSNGLVDRDDFDTGEVIGGLWRTEIEPLQSIGHLGINNYSQSASILRDKLADYCYGEGAVPWQNRMIGLKL